jgi:outer membrane protein OmpA-like peptidoglycan-associated protein
MCSVYAHSIDWQWANRVVDYSYQFGTREFSAREVLGKPSVMPDFGKSPAAWLVKYPSSKTEWIRLEFANPIFIKQILVNENFNPGAIVRIILYDSIGRGHQVYNNNSPMPKPIIKQPSRFFIDSVKFRSKELKIELNLFNYLEDYQIDAVAISSSNEAIPIQVNLPDKSTTNPIFKENLGANVNSKWRELAPIISSDGKTLYFTREGHPDNYGSRRHQDIWYSKADSSGKFALAENIGAPVNNENTNFAFALSPDGNVIYLGHVYLPDGRNISGFSKSIFDGTKWSMPESLNVRNYYNRSRSGSFSISSDGKTMLLAIERDDSYGFMDIYVSFLLVDGTWSEPKNLGNTINTAAEEVSPYLASDGKTLYFSTGGHPGFGDNDMFFSKRLDDTWTNWSEPVNLGSGINTRGWDAYYTISADGKYAYFVSSENSIGTEDIFRLELPKEITPDPVYLVRGKVLNSKTEQPVSASIKYETLPDGNEAGFASSNALTGDYRIVLPSGKKYGYYAIAEGFVAVNQNLDLRKVFDYGELNVDLYLVPIEKGQIIRINNIFFDFGKYELLNDSFIELNRLKEILNKNTQMMILITGHTDNIGNDQRNQLLSENRAKSVKQYLIENGIDTNRINIRGLGSKSPIADNSSEDGRQKNRRVEFEIISE